MSLRSLLPIGRSFSPHEARLGRYRPADPGTLPDFSDAAPRTTPCPLPEGPPTNTAAHAAASVSGSSSPVIAPASTTEFSRPHRRGPSKSSSGRRLPLWLENLLMALFGPGNRRRLSNSVQTEMDFRAVRVARNDLTVSDIEAVPIRAPRAETTLSPDCRKRVLRLWFDQGSRRLRRWGSSLF